MDRQASTMQLDVNRGLRDRLDRNRASEASSEETAQQTLAEALNDLQDLARTRLATHPSRRL